MSFISIFIASGQNPKSNLKPLGEGDYGTDGKNSNGTVGWVDHLVQSLKQRWEHLVRKRGHKAVIQRQSHSGIWSISQRARKAEKEQGADTDYTWSHIPFFFINEIIEMMTIYKLTH